MGWYITITQEMRVLGLKGNELIVFAFINGYSQEGQGCYFGSLAILQEACGISSRQTAIKILKSLLAKGYIVRTEETINRVKVPVYSVCQDVLGGVQKLDTGVQNLDRGCPKNGHNNNNYKYIINSLLGERKPQFKKPSLSEVRDYCEDRANNVDPAQFYDFYESNGWMVGKSHMKDWKAAVRTWERRERKVPPKERERAPKESVFEHNLKVMDELYGTDLHAQAYGPHNDEPDEQ